MSMSNASPDRNRALLESIISNSEAIGASRERSRMLEAITAEADRPNLHPAVGEALARLVKALAPPLSPATGDAC